MTAGIVYMEKDDTPFCYHYSKESVRCHYMPTIIGIASWVGACGYAEYPDVFGRVTSVLDWIKAKTGLVFVFVK